jgi:ankyrin repeat protein
MKIIHVVTVAAFLFAFGCSNNDSALIKALKNNADYGTVKALLDKGANPKARDEMGKSAIELAIAMVDNSQSRIDKIKSGETPVANGNSEVMIGQLESEKEHNQAIVDLLTNR